MDLDNEADSGSELGLVVSPALGVLCHKLSDIRLMWRPENHYSEWKTVTSVRAWIIPITCCLNQVWQPGSIWYIEPEGGLIESAYFSWDGWYFPLKSTLRSAPILKTIIVCLMFITHTILPVIMESEFTQTVTETGNQIYLYYNLNWGDFNVCLFLCTVRI